jgi:hypothetical protein
MRLFMHTQLEMTGHEEAFIPSSQGTLIVHGRILILGASSSRLCESELSNNMLGRTRRGSVM